MLYAIVDIETTGSYAAGSGITEIAIIVHDGKRVLHQWESLINPHRPIPRFIQHLTGISDSMVAYAPSFEEVAGHIHALLQDKIFVAHNVNFDYSFVHHHLKACGYELHNRKLCTIRLARKVAPGYRSYGLGNICHYLNIPHEEKHRAMGDAAATATLFTRLVAEDTEGHLKTMLHGRNKEQYLPPNLPIAQVNELPLSPGVYYFYDAAGKAVYVGKAVNLQQRVKSHFSNNKSSRQKQDFLREIHRVSCQPTATELMAEILESVEIRRLWPKFNRSQRGYHPKFGLFSYEDRQGYLRLAIETNKNHHKPLHTFNTLLEGHQWLRNLQEEFQLCHRLCHLSKTEHQCETPGGVCGTAGCPAAAGPEAYNELAKEALSWVEKALPTLAITGPGLNGEDQSVVLVEKGCFYGMGYITAATGLDDVAALKLLLTPYPDNDYIRHLIYRSAANCPEQCVRWEG